MDWIILAIVLIIVGCAVAYIVKAKKQGVKCIGCSSGGGCHCNHGDHHGDQEVHSCCGCHGQTAEEHSEK